MINLSEYLRVESASGGIDLSVRRPVIRLPVITQQPVSATVTAPATATLTAAGDNITGWQWQRLNGSTWANIPGATSASYTTGDAGSYRVIGSGKSGTVPATSDTAAVTVNYNFYIGYRSVNTAGTAPATTGEFSQQAEGQQTLTRKLSGGKGANLVISKYAKGSTSPVAGGTTGSTFTVSDTSVATVEKAGNDYSLTVTPAKAGTTTLIVKSASGDAIGTLTIIITGD